MLKRILVRLFYSSAILLLIISVIWILKMRSKKSGSSNDCDVYTSVISDADYEERSSFCEENNPTNDNLHYDAEEYLLTLSSYDDLPREIWEVFTNGREFVRIAKKWNPEKGVVELLSSERYTIFNFELPNNTYDEKIYWVEYSIIDFDGDGSNELYFVLQFEHQPEVAVIVFSLVEGDVYAYVESIDSFDRIFADGTLIESEGACVSKVYRITKFSETGFDTHVIAEGNGLEDEYYIDGQSVSEEKFWEDYFNPLYLNKEQCEVYYTKQYYYLHP